MLPATKVLFLVVGKNLGAAIEPLLEDLGAGPDTRYVDSVGDARAALRQDAPAIVLIEAELAVHQLREAALEANQNVRVIAVGERDGANADTVIPWAPSPTVLADVIHKNVWTYAVAANTAGFRMRRE